MTQLTSPQGVAILIVEDHPGNASYMNIMLSSLGHKPKVVANGSQALAAVTGDTYALVLLDERLPDQMGTELCPALKQAGVTCPIVGMASEVNTALRQASLAAGMIELHDKNFSIDEMKQLIEEYCA
ncbi:MAG: hypothetical protein CMM93_07435 [Rickettsiales bacterium]|nr:hypothetical protein [Rickettsiales bacterium]|tara:strand:- start:705 stop:1085 length:381 start_codon:yes stop_codon:yes gene_type:complete